MKNVGPFEPKFALADTEWFIRATRRHRTVYQPYLGVVNRRHTGASGNWSSRVGSVMMQRELRVAIDEFVTWARENHVIATPSVSRQFAGWLARYRLLLLRIYVSRSRAGRFEVAGATVDEILRATPWLRPVAAPLRGTLSGVSRGLYQLQAVLPGGRRKYEELGKYVPL